MWEMLLGVAASGCALLITTHSMEEMEEADKLATRIGIMKRRMPALGTSKVLRNRWGGAWMTHLILRSAPHTTKEEIERVRA